MAPNVPEESQATNREVSQQAASYFARLRENHLQRLKDEQKMGFFKLYHEKEYKDG